MNHLKEFFKQSQDGFPNYRATFTHIDKVFPIEGTDHLVRAIVAGRSVVVSNNIPLDNIYVYVPVESKLSHIYLKSNNLYRLSRETYYLNSNFDQVTTLLGQGKKFDDLKEMGGFFEKSGRVKQLKIRGVYSEGYLADIKSLQIAYPELDQYMIDEFDELDGVSFDVIGNDIFCQKYTSYEIKPTNSIYNQKSTKEKSSTNIIIPGRFKYHYNTSFFEDHYKEFKPSDVVTIAVKVHGSSGVFANILCHKENLNWIQRLFKCFWRPKEYRFIYASRTQIRNGDINGVNIWAPVASLLMDHIDKGMTVYGEIVGYKYGTDKMIQKNHDYGCETGEWKFMPYRITTTEKDGKKREWNVDEVAQWTTDLKVHLAISHKYQGVNHLMTIPILYKGKLGKLYDDLDIHDDNWNLNLLERMKNDRDFLGMEEKEPFCNMNVPREGVVIRRYNDTEPRAWKLKTNAHRELEKKSHDIGELDIEDIS